MLLYAAKCTVHVRNFLLKQLSRLNSFVFIGIQRFRPFQVCPLPSLRVRPCNKAGSPPPIPVLCHEWNCQRGYSFAHFNNALYHFRKFAPEAKQVRPTYTSFMSWMELQGRLFNTDQFSSGMIRCFEWIIAIYFVIGFTLVFIP